MNVRGVKRARPPTPWAISLWEPLCAGEAFIPSRPGGPSCAIVYMARRDVGPRFLPRASARLSTPHISSSCVPQKGGAPRGATRERAARHKRYDDMKYGRMVGACGTFVCAFRAQTIYSSLAPGPFQRRLRTPYHRILVLSYHDRRESWRVPLFFCFFSLG